MVVDLFLVYQFIKRLATPFNEWKAHELGIIDEDGNILIKQRDLNTREQRQAFGKFDIMILNIKKMLSKLPGGQSRLASIAAAMYLIREGVDIDQQLIETSMKTEIINKLFEEGIVNTSGGGNIAGTPPGEPIVGTKGKKKILRRNKANTVDPVQ